MPVKVDVRFAWSRNEQEMTWLFRRMINIRGTWVPRLAKTFGRNFFSLLWREKVNTGMYIKKAQFLLQIL